MAAGGTRQRMTLSDQLSLLQPTNLRDLLKLQDEDLVPRRSPSVTLAAALSSEKTSTSAAVDSGEGGGSRTLLEVIREGDEESRVSGGSFSWRNLADRLRISHAAAASAAWTAGSPPSSNPTTEGAVSDETVRVSLMTLMEMREREEEETTGARAPAGDEVAAEEEEEEEDDVAEVAKRHVCCVCMVRKKGAAFIPCGHTFCRVCSRELFLGRGNCPLCNGTISDVLDIF